MTAKSYKESCNGDMVTKCLNNVQNYMLSYRKQMLANRKR